MSRINQSDDPWINLEKKIPIRPAISASTERGEEQKLQRQRDSFLQLAYSCIIQSSFGMHGMEMKQNLIWNWRRWDLQDLAINQCLLIRFSVCWYGQQRDCCPLIAPDFNSWAGLPSKHAFLGEQDEMLRVEGNMVLAHRLLGLAVRLSVRWARPGKCAGLSYRVDIWVSLMSCQFADQFSLKKKNRSRRLDCVDKSSRRKNIHSAVGFSHGNGGRKQPIWSASAWNEGYIHASLIFPFSSLPVIRVTTESSWPVSGTQRIERRCLILSLVTIES